MHLPHTTTGSRDRTPVSLAGESHAGATAACTSSRAPERRKRSSGDETAERPGRKPDFVLQSRIVHSGQPDSPAARSRHSMSRETWERERRAGDGQDVNLRRVEGFEAESPSPGARRHRRRAQASTRTTSERGSSDQSRSLLRQKWTSSTTDDAEAAELRDAKNLCPEGHPF